MDSHPPQTVKEAHEPWEPPADLDISSRALSQWVRYGLYLLVNACEDTGQKETARYWRQKALMLEYVLEGAAGLGSLEQASLELIESVTGGLEELAKGCPEIGISATGRARWLALAECVRGRAWHLERTAWAQESIHA